MYHLSREDTANIRACLNKLRNLLTQQSEDVITGEDILSLKHEDIDFGDFKAKLLEIRQDVYNGKGFCLMRGFPIESYTREEVMILNYTIGMTLGIPNAQNTKVSVAH